MSTSLTAASTIGSLISAGPKPTKTTTPPLLVALMAVRMAGSAPEHSMQTSILSIPAFLIASRTSEVALTVSVAPSFLATTSLSSLTSAITILVAPAALAASKETRPIGPFQELELNRKTT